MAELRNLARIAPAEREAISARDVAARRGLGGMNARARQWLPAILAMVVLSPARAAERHYEFDVNLDKRPIGTHRFTVQHQPDGSARVQSTAVFNVRVLGIPAYRYQHQAAELWRDDCLAAIDATTQDNGRATRVQGLRNENRFHLELPVPRALPACVSAYAYWNRDLLLRQRALLNPQTGKLDEVRIEALGSQQVDVQGRSVSAERFRLHAAQYTIDLWYSPRGEWLRLESATGSRRLVYRLRSAT